MNRYSSEVESQMKAFHETLSEKDRRRYAAVEAVKLGHGGTEYLANLLGCDEKTIRRGKEEIDQLPCDPLGGRIRRRKGNASGESVSDRDLAADSDDRI